MILPALPSTVPQYGRKHASLWSPQRPKHRLVYSGNLQERTFIHTAALRMPNTGRPCCGQRPERTTHHAAFLAKASFPTPPEQSPRGSWGKVHNTSLGPRLQTFPGQRLKGYGEVSSLVGMLLGRRGRGVGHRGQGGGCGWKRGEPGREEAKEDGVEADGHGSRTEKNKNKIQRLGKGDVEKRTGEGKGEATVRRNAAQIVVRKGWEGAAPPTPPQDPPRLL